MADPTLIYTRQIREVAAKRNQSGGSIWCPGCDRGYSSYDEVRRHAYGPKAGANCAQAFDLLGPNTVIGADERTCDDCGAVFEDADDLDQNHRCDMRADW